MYNWAGKVLIKHSRIYMKMMGYKFKRVKQHEVLFRIVHKITTMMHFRISANIFKNKDHLGNFSKTITNTD